MTELGPAVTSWAGGEIESERGERRLVSCCEMRED